MSMRGKQRKVRIRARDLYVQHLAEVRRIARQVAEDQRVVAAWAYPSPYRLWAIATDRRRVWERRLTDPDFLKVCVGVGQAPLSTPIRLATRNDPTIEYDNRAKAAADRLIDTMSTVGSQPAVVDLAEAGVVSVLGCRRRRPRDRAGHALPDRGAARAGRRRSDHRHRRRGLGMGQVAAAHARLGRQRGVGGDAAWSPRNSRASPTGSARRWKRRARRPDRRSPLFGRGEPEQRRRLVVVLDRYDPRAAWARSPLAAELLAAAGPNSAITVICIAEREEDQPTRADVRVRVAADGALTLDGRLADRGGTGQRHRRRLAGTVLCEAIARELAPLRLSAESEEILAQVMSLPSMLGIGDLDTLEPRGPVGRSGRRGSPSAARRLRRRRAPARAGPQGGGTGRHGPARADRRRDRLGQERAAAHPGHRPGRHALARPAQLRAGGLQGRRDLRRGDRAAARGRHDHQPGRRPGPGRPGQDALRRRAAAAPADPA